MGTVGDVLARGVGLVTSRTVARPLVLPSRAAVVTVGGSTLGGSGKTRLALGCVRELAAEGVRVALVGHAYRARPSRARVVTATDALAEVGDEALACARELDGVAPVIVAPTRQAAVDLAAELADVIVVDGPLQTAPVRAHLALLAVDADAPWGSGRVVPAGDLRAPRGALLANADRVVPVAAGPVEVPFRRFALFTALARPERLVRALATPPAQIISVPDHGPAVSAAREVACWEGAIDGWVATSKCAIHLATLAPARTVHVLPAAAPIAPELRAALLALGKP